MKLKSTFLILLILCSISLNAQEKYEPKDLRKLSNTELMEKAKDKTYFQIENAVFKNEKGVIISLDSVSKLSDAGIWVANRYVDSNGEIKELVLTTGTKEELAFQDKLIEVFSKPDIAPVVSIDCSKKGELLSSVYARDIASRQEGAVYNPDDDAQNLAIVISLIENCGMPTLQEVNKEQMMAVWLVFQHGDSANMTKYFPMLQAAADNGDLEKNQIALMQDRILMDAGKPQIYGSQITRNNDTGTWILYQLDAPEDVDKRRASVGLGPLKEYVSSWDIVFEVKQSK